MHKLEDFGVTKHIGYLDNGVRVILFYKPNSPIATDVLYLTGSRYDPVGKEGLSHFLEHIIFKKTKKFASQTEAFKYLEEIGGIPNAFTWIEALGLDINIALESDYPKLVTFIDEVINNTAFENEHVEKEREIILDEKRRYESSPEMYLEFLSDELFFQNTDIAKSTIGSEESLRSISWKDLREAFEKNLNPKDAVIIVSGDIKMDTLLSSFNKIFPKVSEKNPITKDINDLPITRDTGTLIKRFKDTPQVYLKYGFRTCSRFDDDTYVLSLIATALGEGASSSLFTKLRQENGLVYGVSADIVGTRDAGSWCISTATLKNNVQKLLDIVSDEFGRVYNGELTKSEIELAKNKLIKSQIIKLQTTYQWVGAHALNVLYWGEDFPTVIDYLNIFEKINLEDIKRVGKKYFKPETWYLAMCGDIDEKDVIVNY
ncbi:insulinase family protein [Patescibacteria group bacterium]|nr:insulinase family protein [Patescibacteria group bacterium]